VPERDSSSSIDPWVGVVIIVRVVVILIIWLGLFLSIFLGYFTVPILLIGLVTVIYMLSDLGIFVAIKRRQQAMKERQKMIETPPEELEKRE